MVIPQKISASLAFSEWSRTRASLFLEAIPHATLGEDQLWARRVLFELLAEVANVHVDRPLVAVLRVAQHVLEQLGAGGHPAWLAREREQDLELEEGQLHLLAVALDLALAGVDAQRAAHERLVRRLLSAVHPRPSQDRLHAAAQLAHRARLDDVVVGAELQAEHAVGDLFGFGSEHDDRDRALGADAPADLEAVELRQHHVEHHEVERLLADLVERLLAVERGYDVVTLAAECAVEELLNGLLVVDDEYAWRCSGHFFFRRNGIRGPKVRCRT